MLTRSSLRWPAALPGIVLCCAVTIVAWALDRVEAAIFDRAWLEALVLAILLGMALRSLWTPGPAWRPGIGFSARFLLELAVMLLGAGISLGTLAAVGPALLAGIALVVVSAIAASYGLGRGLGLGHRMAVLIACGNSICGNSAIAAVAPVIGADADDIAASIAFTAALGVAVVLALPLLVPMLHLSLPQYGILAGLTVYAVPQVVAATAPLGLVAVQLGTLVKLVRVLMLGPVVVALSLRAAATAPGAVPGVAPGVVGGRPRLRHLVPWFIIGFLALAGLRSAQLLPPGILPPVALAANALTVVSMAALGLGVDLRVVAGAGARVTATVVVSLLLLGAISLGLIHLLRIG